MKRILSTAVANAAAATHLLSLQGLPYIGLLNGTVVFGSDSSQMRQITRTGITASKITDKEAVLGTVTGEVVIVDLNLNPLTHLKGNTFGITSVDLSNGLVFAGTSEGTIVIWDPRKPDSPSTTLNCETEPLIAIGTFGPWKQYVASTDGQIFAIEGGKEWRVSPVRSIEKLQPLSAGAFLPNNWFAGVKLGQRDVYVARTTGSDEASHEMPASVRCIADARSYEVETILVGLEDSVVLLSRSGNVLGKVDTTSPVTHVRCTRGNSAFAIAGLELLTLNLAAS